MRGGGGGGYGGSYAASSTGHVHMIIDLMRSSLQMQFQV